MTKAQRRVLEDALRKAEHGPTFALSGHGALAEEHFQRAAQAWAESWIADNIREVLRVEDGELSSRDLLYLFPNA